MSDLNITNFFVTDYKNENVLSSYSLPQTPLLFVPDVEDINFSKVLWNFGDDTYSNSISASKYYTYPGKYTVSLVIYDCGLNATVSTITKDIVISDYITHTFNISFNDNNLNDSIVWKNGQINGPLIFQALVPWNINPSNIFYSISSNSGSDYYYDVEDEKYSHLLNNNSFFKTKYNYYIQSNQYIEIPFIEMEYDSIYCKIKDDQIVTCAENDQDSFFVGVSSEKSIYFKDDSTGDSIIDFFFDKTKTRNDGDESYTNNLKISLSAKIIENDEVDKISITTNGLDGEYYPITSFNFYPIKYSNVDIPFVLKVKDLSGFSVKNFDNLTIDQFTISILSSGNTIPPYYYTITQVESYNGAVMGKILFNIDNRTEYVTMSTSAMLSNLQGSSFSLSGISNSFEIVPENFVTLQKINEDFDATEMYKSLRFQEFLLDKNVLFDDFIGSIFGNENSNYDTIGKKIHEKTTNFTENHVDIDRCEVNALISHMDMLNTDNISYDKTSMISPEKIKRCMNLASIEKNKLFGYENKFDENFDIKGRSSKDEYGKNLGDEINTTTYEISAGIHIVALEKFSNNYTLLNTYQPIEFLETNRYKLSAYTYDWGWPLVLPDIFTPNDFDKYYTFFEYISGFEGDVVGNSIIYNEDYEYLVNKNSLSAYGYSNDKISKKFLLENETLNTLYQSLSLFK